MGYAILILIQNYLPSHHDSPSAKTFLTFLTPPLPPPSPKLEGGVCHAEAASGGFILKKVFLKIPQNSLGNTSCARVSFFNKVADLGLQLC